MLRYVLLRYVLLRHDCPADYRDGPHWDLMLESGAALRTWSLLELPAAWRSDQGGSATVDAQQLPDHRLAYLDYEGEVSGGRGTVRRVAAGEYRLGHETSERVEVVALSGDLAGRWQLDRQHDARWRLQVDG